MPDTITPQERALIDAAIAEGAVTHVGRGVSAFCDVWDPRAKRIVPTGKGKYKIAPQIARGQRKGALKTKAGPCAEIVRRRKRVKELVERGLDRQQILAEMPGVTENQLRKDLETLGLRAGRNFPKVEERRQIVKQMVEAGVPKKTILIHLSVSRKTLDNDFSALGIRAPWQRKKGAA